MQRNKIYKERVKTLLLVLLSISAVFLGLRTGLFDEPLRAGGFGGSAPVRTVADQAYPAAFPTTIMVSLGEGVYHGQRMDGQGDAEEEGLEVLFGRFAVFFGEALESAGFSEPVTMEEWERALTDLGVFFQYDVEIPGDVLARWFDTEASGELGAMERMTLSASQNAVYLYYMGRDDLPRRRETTVDVGALRGQIQSLAPNGAQYGFQVPAFTGTNRSTVLLAQYEGIPVIRGHNAISAVFEHLDTMLEHFGMHLSRVRYLDVSGVRTMVEDDATLRLTEHGLVHYHCQADAPRLVAWEGERSFAGAVETGREVAQILERLSGDATIQLSDWYDASAYSDGQLVLYFSYYLGGIPVWTEYPAARIVIRGRYVREVTLFARTFVRTGHFSAVMPELQATAASGGEPLTLAYVYAEEGNENWRARWLVTPRREEVAVNG